MSTPRKRKASQPSERASSFAGMGFLRVAVVVPQLRVADVGFNQRQILGCLQKAVRDGVQLAVFPELSLTSYSCADLFYQSTLRQQAVEALESLARASAKLPIAYVVGLPLVMGDRLYNSAAFVSAGRIHGIVPKTYLPTTQEFYEERWFTSGRSATGGEVTLLSHSVPFGTDLLFQSPGRPEVLIGIEICEDLWAVQPPSGFQALAGANVLLNLSASNEVLGKAEYRRMLVQQQSARCLAAYVYASAGPGESSADTVYSGHGLIAENGALLVETQRFSFLSQIAVADLDLQRLQNDRLRNSSYSAAAGFTAGNWRRIPFPLHVRTSTQLRRPLSPTPFVPRESQQRAAHCQEIVAIQTTGLKKRLLQTGVKTVVIGLSGGLDSTLALLAAVRSFDDLHLPRRQILAVTLPGFGTTPRTRDNATQLTHELGIELRTISIEAAVRQHFADIQHAESVTDVVYENAQARERTQILMDLANQVGGFVVGTGDLSEAALGWCTFNGDHMSMYHVNIGIPKTLVRYVIEWMADSLFTGEIARVLRDIVETPISPELLPLDGQRGLQQKTEETVGPYELHDFFLYYFLRHQFAAAKILYLAEQVFLKKYSPKVIRQWLKVFLARFVGQQFKRSSMPDGPKVGSVALSPRADWRMPSDSDYHP